MFLHRLTKKLSKNLAIGWGLCATARHDYAPIGVCPGPPNCLVSLEKTQ